MFTMSTISMSGTLCCRVVQTVDHKIDTLWASRVADNSATHCSYPLSVTCDGVCCMTSVKWIPRPLPSIEWCGSGRYRVSEAVAGHVYE